MEEVTAASAPRVTYAELTRGIFTRSQPVSSDTKRVIKLRQGRFLDITPEAGEMHAARARWNSAIRTARLHTGRRYRVVTRNKRLYVVCLKPEADAGEES